MPQRSPTSTAGMSPGKPRLFFALWPGTETRHALFRESRSTVLATDGRPVAARNFHMTLVFLGVVAAEAVSLVQSIAASVHGERFRLELDRYGYWKEPQVLWCGASRVVPAAAMLAATLRERLANAGFKPDPKPFVPHVTLARKVHRPGELGPFGPLSWHAKEFALVRSVTGADGSEYSPLATYALGSGGDVKIGQQRALI